jgi:hypothetical protein
MTVIERRTSFWARAYAPVDGASLAFFRVVIGSILLVAVLRYFWNDWVDALFYARGYSFSYEGLEWIMPWPRPFMHVHLGVMAAAALCIALGAYYRVATAIYLVLFTYAHLIDKANYLNHYYLVSLLLCLMLFLPLHSVASVDAWRRRRGGREPIKAPAEYALWTLRAQFGLVYFFGGVAKLGADWLFDAQPLRMWLNASGEIPLIGNLLREPAMAYVFAWGGLVFDLGIAFALCFPRVRRWAFCAVALFHALTATLFPIGIFPWVMTLGATLFFAPGWPRTLVQKLLRRRGPPAPHEPLRQVPRIPVVLGCLGAWFTVQLAAPLRALFGPPDLHWHESNIRFGWRVMVMEKTAVARFELAELGGAKRRWQVDPSTLLTAFQVRQMSTQPDMLVQFARHLARRHVEKTGVAVSVRAHVFASLNGRPALLLLDPDADLAATPHRPALAYVRPRARTSRPRDPRTSGKRDSLPTASTISREVNAGRTEPDAEKR